MHKGLPKFVVVNLQKIEDAGFQEGDEVSLETLKNKRLINPSGRERRLPLKVCFIFQDMAFNSYNRFLLIYSQYVCYFLKGSMLKLMFQY